MISQCSILKRLVLQDGKWLTSTVMDCLAEHTPHLQYLDIHGTVMSADSILRVVAACRRLRTLRFTHFALSEVNHDIIMLAEATNANLCIRGSEPYQ